MTSPTYDGSTPLDMEAIQELCDRRQNGYASIEHEGQLMDSVPALLARVRYLEAELAKRDAKPETPKASEPFRITGPGWHMTRGDHDKEPERVLVSRNPYFDRDESDYQWQYETNDGQIHTVSSVGEYMILARRCALDIVSRCEDQEGEG